MRRLDWMAVLAAMLASTGCQQTSPPRSAGERAAAPERIDVVGEQAGPGSLSPLDPPPDGPGREGEPLAVADASDTPFTWSARSADGVAEVRQVPRDGAKDPARCTTSSTVSPPHEELRRVMWKWDTCIATRAQFKFVSPDGQRVLVLDPEPEPVGEQGRDAEGVTLYEQGLRVKFLRVGAAVEAPVARRWVKAPPIYSADGMGITFESLDGRFFALGFDGRGFPPAAEDVRAFMAAEGLYRYQDAQGTTQVVNSVDHIPERYRGRARSVKAQVPVQPAAPKVPEAPVAAVAPPPAKPDLPLGDLTQLPELKSPGELVREARDTVQKVQKIRREQDRVLETLH